jgi:DNA polymerase-1
LGVSLDEAKELIARYFKAYPLIQKWLDKAARDAVRNGYSATALGRKRYYNIPDESLKSTNEDEYRKQIASIERQGKNSPIQGANADMTKLALIYLRNTLKGWDARTVNTVHDEIVVEAREDQADEVKHLVEDAMVRAGQAILKDVPIVAEAAVADYWSK